MWMTRAAERPQLSINTQFILRLYFEAARIYSIADNSVIAKDTTPHYYSCELEQLTRPASLFVRKVYSYNGDT